MKELPETKLTNLHLILELGKGNVVGGMTLICLFVESKVPELCWNPKEKIPAPFITVKVLLTMKGNNE